jgi:hypothetical protein
MGVAHPTVLHRAHRPFRGRVLQTGREHTLLRKYFRAATAFQLLLYINLRLSTFGKYFAEKLKVINLTLDPDLHRDGVGGGRCPPYKVIDHQKLTILDIFLTFSGIPR